MPDIAPGGQDPELTRLDAPAPLRFAVVVDGPPGVLRGYEDAVLALLGRHGGVVETRLYAADGRSEVQTITFAERAGYVSFLADPERAALRDALGTDVPTARVIPL